MPIDGMMPPKSPNGKVNWAAFSAGGTTTRPDCWPHSRLTERNTSATSQTPDSIAATAAIAAARPEGPLPPRSP